MGIKAWCIASQTRVFRKIERNRHGAFQEDPFVDFEAAQSFLVQRLAFCKAPCVVRCCGVKESHATASGSALFGVHETRGEQHAFGAARVMARRRARLPSRLRSSGIPGRAEPVVFVFRRLERSSADVAGPRPPVEAAAPHPLLAALDRGGREMVVAATRTETAMIGASISMWVGLFGRRYHGGSGAGRNGTSG